MYIEVFIVNKAINGDFYHIDPIKPMKIITQNRLTSSAILNLELFVKMDYLYVFTRIVFRVHVVI